MRSLHSWDGLDGAEVEPGTCPRCDTVPAFLDLDEIWCEGCQILIERCRDCGEWYEEGDECPGCDE